MHVPSIPDVVPVRQVSVRKKSLVSKPRSHVNRALEVEVRFATAPDAPTLQQARNAAVDCLARLLVACFREYGREFPGQLVKEWGEQ